VLRATIEEKDRKLFKMNLTKGPDLSQKQKKKGLVNRDRGFIERLGRVRGGRRPVKGVDHNFVSLKKKKSVRE